MTPALAPLAAGALGASLVVLAALARRPQPARALPGRATGGGPTGPSPVVRLGRPLATRLGAPSDDATARRLGVTAMVAAALAVITPLASVLLVAVTAAQARAAALRRRQSHERQVAAVLPDTVDLLLLCTGAGISLPLAHGQLVGRVPPPVGEALQAAAEAADRGRPRADALLDALAPLGDRALALAHVLTDHLRYGTPLVPGLERLSLELRLDRRRRAELEARKVPVRLLGPLVACILPAFALLTVVPLLAASLRSLPA